MGMSARRSFWFAAKGVVLGLGAGLALFLAGCEQEKPPPIPPYVLSRTVEGDFDEVLTNVKDALGRKNFPVTNVRDYRKSLLERYAQVGGGTLPFHRYNIVEGCNLELAQSALRTDPGIGVFLPCRVVIFQKEENGPIKVMAVNPAVMPWALNNPALGTVAEQVAEAMDEALKTADF